MKLNKKRRDVISLFLPADKASCANLDALKTIKRAVINTREDGIAIINARHNETEDEFDSGLSGEMFSNQTDAAKVIVTGFSSLRDSKIPVTSQSTSISFVGKVKCMESTLSNQAC